MIFERKTTIQMTRKNKNRNIFELLMSWWKMMYFLLVYDQNGKSQYHQFQILMIDEYPAH